MYMLFSLITYVHLTAKNKITPLKIPTICLYSITNIQICSIKNIYTKNLKISIDVS